MRVAAAGYEHSLIVTQHGHVFTFGADRTGQLGLGQDHKYESEDPRAHFKATPQPVNITLDGNEVCITDVAAGAAHCIALDAKGRIFGWGNNDSGQLGGWWDEEDQDEVFFERAPVHMKLNGETTVRVAACGNNTYALNARGQLFQWGVMEVENEPEQYQPNSTPIYIGVQDNLITTGSFFEQNIIAVTKENKVMQIYRDVDENNYPTSKDAPHWRFIEMKCNQQSIINGTPAI